jgi:DNA-binding GntR family transcriptional regulator
MNESRPLRSMADPIYDSIKRSILLGALAPGEPLRQDEIARVHGVSKIPVREALLRLEVDGYVLFRKNRGAIVRGLSAEEVLHIMDIRVALECRALECAIPNMIEADFQAARGILESYGNQADVEQWSDLNIRFHQVLYEPCDNPELLRMIVDLRHRLGPALRRLVTETTGPARPRTEHEQILAACEARDTSRAVALLRAHIEITKKETAARLRQSAARARLQGRTLHEGSLS